jgi:hypothetical protein
MDIAWFGWMWLGFVSTAIIVAGFPAALLSPTIIALSRRHKRKYAIIAWNIVVLFVSVLAFPPLGHLGLLPTGLLLLPLVVWSIRGAAHPKTVKDLGKQLRRMGLAPIPSRRHGI